MVYRHQYFKLDTESRKVFDENSKELYLTGNPFLLLSLLCEKKHVTITEINEFFDPAESRDYTEEHVRQYRHGIKKAIGREVIEYKNKAYSIVGDISVAEKDEERNSKAGVLSPKVILSKKSKRKAVFVFLSIVLISVPAIFFIKIRIDSGLKPKDDMVLISAGNFLMGSTEQQALDAFAKCDEQNGCVKNDYLAEYPQHVVFVRDFYMDRKSVSNADYKLFVRETKRKNPPYWNDSNLNSPSQPVVGVDFDDATAYCAWVGKRLPSEAEREKAARGIDDRVYPWGNDWGKAKDNHGQGGMPGRNNEDGFEYTAPVGTELGVSPYGVLNMAGNVWEWTVDEFNPYPGNDKYSNENYGQGFKIIKGGSYDEDQTQQRVASRYSMKPGNSDSNIGFRCVKDKS